LGIRPGSDYVRVDLALPLQGVGGKQQLDNAMVSALKVYQGGLMGEANTRSKVWTRKDTLCCEAQLSTTFFDTITNYEKELSFLFSRFVVIRRNVPVLEPKNG
jgi:hypothetical protein